MFPLTHAVRSGDLAETLRLLRDGASGDVDGERDDDQGWTPLFWAARDGRADLVAALLACGADPLAKDVDGQTPVDQARATKRAELVRLFEALIAPPKKRPASKKPRASPRKATASSKLTDGTRFAALIQSPSPMRYHIELPVSLAKEVGGFVRISIAGRAPSRCPVDTVGKKRLVRVLGRMLTAAGVDEGDRVEVEVAPITRSARRST